MGWWKADPLPLPAEPTAVKTPSSRPTIASTEPPLECPVDPKTRSLWLQQAKRSDKASPIPQSHPSVSAASTAFTSTPATECSSDRVDQSLNPPRASPPTSGGLTRPLSHDRVVSSIPRAFPHQDSPASSPANSESETGAHHSGNWIYPSESQFYHAVLRKHDPAAIVSPSLVNEAASPTNELAATMPTVIPIHNAVNERAWALIKTWEGNTSEKCGGPKLASFKGLGAGALSPKARFNSLLGYTVPFDRHDWVVERCDGSRVEYCIDFYQGKDETEKKSMGQLNFYLDVRPKINTVEGVRMRVERAFGWR